MNTRQVILAQLQENTGRHILDSGGAYGRSWERNQGKQWEDLTKDRVKVEAFVHNGRLELSCEISTAAWMENNLSFSEELQQQFDQYCELQGNDKSWLELMEGFADEVGDGGKMILNTYNEESDLSQVLQWVSFHWQDSDGWTEEAVLLQVHGGCDVRSGYTAPKAYTLRDEYPSLVVETFATVDGHVWSRDGVSDNRDQHPDLHDLPAYHIADDPGLVDRHLDALKMTDRNNEAVQKLIREGAVRVHRLLFEDFCEGLDHEAVVVWNRTPYYVSLDSEPVEIFGDSTSLGG